MKKSITALSLVFLLTACQNAQLATSPMPFVAPTIDKDKNHTPNQHRPTIPQQAPKSTGNQKQQKPRRLFILEDWF